MIPKTSKWRTVSHLPVLACPQHIPEDLDDPRTRAAIQAIQSRFPYVKPEDLEFTHHGDNFTSIKAKSSPRLLSEITLGRFSR